MKLGIDASNINSGGGLVHLIELLSYLNISKNIDTIIVWSSKIILDKLPEDTNIIKKTNIFLNKNLLLRSLWQIIFLGKELNKEGCNIFFTPGSTLVLTKIPIINMCQNLLPFSWFEIKRFGLSLFTLKLIALRCVHSLSFYNAEGIIFLSEFSKNKILKKVNLKMKKIKIIPHGVDKKFFKPIKTQYNIKKYSNRSPFKFLCVSHLWPYKNYLIIINSIASLRKLGYPITLDIVGGSFGPKTNHIHKTINRLDPEKKFIFYHGVVDQTNIENFYHKSDGLIFGSSCETFGQIITEAMLSGIPIICSKTSSMPELLGKSCVYYNPFSELELMESIKYFLIFNKARAKMSKQGQLKAMKMTWLNCSKETFTFISQFGNINKINKIR